jgi:hypothetical protein
MPSSELVFQTNALETHTHGSTLKSGNGDISSLWEQATSLFNRNQQAVICGVSHVAILSAFIHFISIYPPHRSDVSGT